MDDSVNEFQTDGVYDAQVSLDTTTGELGTVADDYDVWPQTRADAK